MVLAPFVNYNMDAIFPFCAEAAQFIGANLKNADLSGADLSNTNLRGANLDGANLEKIRTNSKTVLPRSSS
jgi:uncharacterized protein YjbI with pentapeptide repeats